MLENKLQNGKQSKGSAKSPRIKKEKLYESSTVWNFFFLIMTTSCRFESQTSNEDNETAELEIMF